jgi:very-short-patch-repair endonuclease
LKKSKEYDMDNSPGPKTKPPSPANVSADFLTGSTHTGLDRIRTRLLDLTNRNKLLNFRHSNSSSLRVVDIAIDPAFARLRDNEKLAFLPVPEPDIERGEEVPPAKDCAALLDWNTSFDLDGATEQPEGLLPVLHYQEQLDTVSRKIASAAKTAIEESGTNMLYLICGFLEWHESDDSAQTHLAPLVVVPVTIERSGGKGKAVETVIEYSGEDVESNLSLVEKMRRDFGLEIPLFEDEDTPESYFGKFETILTLKKRWSIRRHVTLALLSFGKLLMYRDLDPKNWPANKSIADHPLVKELFEGSKNSTVMLAEEFAIDEPELKKDIPHLIRDADSSQHSALVHALRGQNLVIEGPPGTGKSQTITNLIAAALARGKTVLFVAEKLAALEVVRRRLDDAGLGIFCLEVHSHKTKKGALLNDISHRLQMRGSFRDPRDLDGQLSVVEDKKRLLTHYSALINKMIEPFQATIFEILWARDRCGQDIAGHRDRLNQVILRGAPEYTRAAFTQAEQFLAVFAQHLAVVLAPSVSVEKHPWNWLLRPLGYEEEEQILGLLDDFVAEAREAAAQCEFLKETADIALTRSIRGLAHASSMLALLPETTGRLLDSLLIPCRDRSNRRMLADFVESVDSYQKGRDAVSACAATTSYLFESPTAGELGAALEQVRAWGLDGLSVAEIDEILSTTVETMPIVHAAQSSFRVLLDIVGYEIPATAPGATMLLETLRIIEATPVDRLQFREPAFENERAKPLLATAYREAEALKVTEATLGRDFDLSLGNSTLTPGQLLEDASALDHANLFQRLFGSAYRRAVQDYRRVALTKDKQGRAQMSRALKNLAAYVQNRKQFDGNAAYRGMLGAHFQGVNSPWDELQKTVQWYDQVFAALPEHQAGAEPLRRLLFTARTERFKLTKANGSAERRAELQQMATRVAEFATRVPRQRTVMAEGSFDDILACLQRFASQFTEALKAFDRATIRRETKLSGLPEIMTHAGHCRDAIAKVQSASELPAMIGDAYRGVDTEIESIRHTLHFADLVASGTLPAKAVTWLLCEDYASRLTKLRTVLTSVIDCSAKLEAVTGILAAVSDSAFWATTVDGPWTGLLGLAEYALASREELSRWSHFLRLRIKSREAGLDKLTTAAETSVFEPKELIPVFRFAFYNTLARSVFAQHPELSEVTGVTQEQLRQQFAAADKESIRLYSARVAAIIDKRPVPYGNQSGSVRHWTDMALVMHEISKQKRHVPIRQLVLRSADALVALKPCFMMGPLSVAQYLAPGQLKFDLVVMDEASQLKPEDAIGALARGGQVVIVGDPKQLPPTNFFQRVSLDPEDDDAGDDRTAVEEGESILDVASSLFQPVRRLRWHYRSRHHSLIAFSNHEFYQRDLIIFPSAYHDNPALGVKHHFVTGGVFESGRNPREAAVVVEAVLEHMRQHPDESLGVVTLNFEQRELVEELLDQRLRDDPAAIAFQEKMKGGQETLFVKNLENVQGDERDVIFISTTYGPDVRGNQFQRFGPINGPSGHRRLNVLFTRAKNRTVVFSSLDPDRIQTTPNSAWGLRALKQYLIYARTGVLQQAEESLEQPTNDFERSIGTVLKEKGYEVVPQVGVAGFFIDLGVKHPVKPGAYLLGVECDGASYHSGRSARDRDRLRQEILVNLGWKIHRIWSTDWFKSRDSEIKRLLRTIESLLENDPAYRQLQEKARRGESLRKHLEELRDREIFVSFPDASPDCSGLLRPDLLEEFLDKRPKTRDEWFRKIPQNLRTTVDSKQVSQYLDRVLRIIESSEA